MVSTMFKNPQLLNKEKDKAIKISELKDYKHAKKAHFMPISKEESNEACKHYPLFFVKENDGGYTPIALLGVKENTNLFVNKPGDWESGRYIPALIRCYPFSASRNEDRFVIVYDKEYEGVDQKDGRAMFDENGETNEYGQRIIEFVQRVYSDLDLTKNLTKMIQEMDLLKEVNASLEKEGQKYQINGLSQVDVKKLNDLKDEQLLQLTKSGALNLIYAHLMSLTNFENLSRHIK